ncbi:MAG: PIG-L deacetylase family protein [Acidobacteriota bacterium]|nr:PIG-L family deacetylase [Blastocatellia bacterium]MDW8411342.1 PIG-L deacetylase family protein [Acidobacteriota bacterium]
MLTSDWIMVISPHPDDLEIGMGGTVAKLKASGKKIISLVVTDGRRCSRKPDYTEDDMAKIRAAEVETSSALLGIDLLVQLRLHDITTSENCLVATEQMRSLITNYSPQQVYCPHPTLDRHPTHRLCAKLLLDSVDTRNRPEIWAYEVWGLFHSWDRLEDISESIEIKLKAIRCHKSQLEHKAYDVGISGLNAWRGVFTDFDRSTRFAEAFKRL